MEPAKNIELEKNNDLTPTGLLTEARKAVTRYITKAQFEGRPYLKRSKALSKEVNNYLQRVGKFRLNGETHTIVGDVLLNGGKIECTTVTENSAYPVAQKIFWCNPQIDFSLIDDEELTPQEISILEDDDSKVEFTIDPSHGAEGIEVKLNSSTGILKLRFLSGKKFYYTFSASQVIDHITYIDVDGEVQSVVTGYELRFSPNRGELLFIDIRINGECKIHYYNVLHPRSPSFSLTKDVVSILLKHIEQLKIFAEIAQVRREENAGINAALDDIEDPIEGYDTDA